MSKLFPASSELGDDLCLPHNFLFPIAEETKEEMELHASTPPRKSQAVSPVKEEPRAEMELHAGTSPRKSPVVSVEMPAAVAAAPPASSCSSVTVYSSVTENSHSVSASSTSVSFSVTPDATPFATPPSSPSGSESSSSESPVSSPTESLATAVSRLSAHSHSPASATSSPAGTAASRFSAYSQSPSSVVMSPAAADMPLAGTLWTNFGGALLASQSSGLRRSASAETTFMLGDHGPLGALFRSQQHLSQLGGVYSYSPSRYSPLRTVVPRPSSHITDFRHALPCSPPPPNNANKL
ncbi:hypothetical protein KP509_11G009900 [Ceratopteris richardii]|nr:hypothetical protein KP509_11G009900 [Ceratopteris richardii]